jgi:HK97 family phage major capsid protein
MSAPVMDSKLKELLQEKHAKEDAMHQLFESKAISDFTEAVVLDLRSKNDELTELGKKIDPLYSLWTIQQQTHEAHQKWQVPSGNIPNPGGDPSGGRPGDQAEQKSLGEMFTEHAAFKAGRTMSTPRFGLAFEDVDVKTLMSTTAGWAAPNDRTPRVVLSAQRRPVVADLIPQDTTDLSVIKYMEETTFTNNAAPVAEGGTKPEAAIVLTERSQPVEVIATWLPVTKQQMDDVPGIQAFINGRLVFMLQLAEESQLLTGSGTTPALAGFYNKSGVQTQAKGADPTPDAVYKAMNLVRGSTGFGFAEPSGAVFHPLDWEPIRLLRTADGIYIWGSPSEAGPERIWGLPVVITPAATQNTGLVGDFRMFSHISRKQGIQVDVSDSHSTFFIENKLAIRVEERLSLEIYRPAAFSLITGI